MPAGFCWPARVHNCHWELGKAFETKIGVKRAVLWKGDSDLRAEDGTGSELWRGPCTGTGGQQQWRGERVQVQRLGCVQITGRGSCLKVSEGKRHKGQVLAREEPLSHWTLGEPG